MPRIEAFEAINRYHKNIIRQDNPTHENKLGKYWGSVAENHKLYIVGLYRDGDKRTKAGHTIRWKWMLPSGRLAILITKDSLGFLQYEWHEGSDKTYIEAVLMGLFDE